MSEFYANMQCRLGCAQFLHGDGQNINQFTILDKIKKIYKTVLKSSLNFHVYWDTLYIRVLNLNHVFTILFHRKTVFFFKGVNQGIKNLGTILKSNLL